jgi:hypothetical protein
LSAAAGAAKRLKLATGICLVIQRDTTLEGGDGSRLRT